MHKSIPQMPGLPVLGNLLDVRRDRLAFFARVRQQCGGIAQYRLLARPMILISDPAYARAVLIEHAEAVDQTRLFRTLLRPLLGQGLLTSPRPLHQRQRHSIAPAFQHRRIITYADTMAHAAEALARDWRDGAAVDGAREMRHLTLRVIGKVLFDADLRSDAQELGTALTTAIR
jgi:cytochrome P450